MNLDTIHTYNGDVAIFTRNTALWKQNGSFLTSKDIATIMFIYIYINKYIVYVKLVSQ